MKVWRQKNKTGINLLRLNHSDKHAGVTTCFETLYGSILSLWLSCLTVLQCFVCRRIKVCTSCSALLITNYTRWGKELVCVFVCARVDVMGVFLCLHHFSEVVIMLPGWPHAILCVFPCLYLFVTWSEANRITFLFTCLSLQQRNTTWYWYHYATLLKNKYQMPSLLFTGG